MSMNRPKVVAGIGALLVVGAFAHPASGATKKKPKAPVAKTASTKASPTAAPTTSAKSPAGATTVPPAAATGSEIATGSFRRIMYNGAGAMVIAKKADGAREVRLSADFSVESGPALHVYLSAAPADATNEQFAKADFVDLGKLVALKGAQTYSVPADTDLSKYHSVAVWCQKFSVGFVAAPIG